MKKIIILCGPTAVGKTGLALELAETFNAEIISADSQQVWRELDIGTAKPTPEEQSQVKHHLINVANPDEHFDVSRYVQLADEAIEDIYKCGRVPFVVGGAGMYIDTLLHGLCEAPPQDKILRQKLMMRLQQEGLPALLEELQKKDPETAQKLHPNDTTRIVRALEVFELSGSSLSHFHRQHAAQSPRYQALQIGLNCDRRLLHEKIERRVAWMIACGWTEEVRELLKFYSSQSQSMLSIGYKQIVAHLKGEVGLEETILEIKKRTRAFARRQLTWFRGDKAMPWFEPSQKDPIKQKIDLFLSKA